MTQTSSTRTFRCTGIARPDLLGPPPMDLVVLAHDERRVRRTVLTLVHGDRVALDLPDTVMLRHGTRLVLEGGREVQVIAAEEELLEVSAPDELRLLELAWHLGNRHVPLALSFERSGERLIAPPRLLIARDPVLARMLEGLGASLREVIEPFEPVAGAYHSHGHSHDHHPPGDDTLLAQGPAR